ncbi:MAG: hypothetical protein M3N26_06805 [Pseudomonadota bacterium]|nr:hypothetical protein [Pseudomonadota bacterium]
MSVLDLPPDWIVTRLDGRLAIPRRAIEAADCSPRLVEWLQSLEQDLWADQVLLPPHWTMPVRRIEEILP